MTVDEVVKLIFFIGMTLSILGVSFQIMRIFGKLADMMEDIRPSIKNINDISSQATEDYKLMSKAIRTISTSVTDLNNNVIKPIADIGKVLKGFSGGLGSFGIGKNSKKEESE